MVEKTADEMLKELGLVKTIERDSIVKYSKSDLGFKWELVFYSLNNTYEFRINHSISNNLRKHHEPAGIDNILHKAITKQMEELGWLK